MAAFGVGVIMSVGFIATAAKAYSRLGAMGSEKKGKKGKEKRDRMGQPSGLLLSTAGLNAAESTVAAVGGKKHSPGFGQGRH